MERNIGVLGTMSNIAPLLGLFGTVVGIIRAFADIARTGSGGGAVVAMGVSEALMTTAAGIIVAVIATVAFNFFVRRIRTRTAHLEDARESFLDPVEPGAAAAAQRPARPGGLAAGPGAGPRGRRPGRSPRGPADLAGRTEETPWPRTSDAPSSRASTSPTSRPWRT